MVGAHGAAGRGGEPASAATSNLAKERESPGRRHLYQHKGARKARIVSPWRGENSGSSRRSAVRGQKHQPQPRPWPEIGLVAREDSE